MAPNHRSSFGNGDGRLVGFVSDGDVMKSIATYESSTVSTGTGSTMVVFDDETVASKVQALSGKNVMDIATRRSLPPRPTSMLERWPESSPRSSSRNCRWRW